MTHDPLNILGHSVSIGGVVATWAGWLPPALACIASVFAAWFYVLKIINHYQGKDN